ncbi:MAG: hypothetical protein JEZ09_18480 [Salinivirgaceae bacterium]|nr:hypothetical protein [Salinivirgaceae bacterium]
MNIISLLLIFLGISAGVLVTTLKSEDHTADLKKHEKEKIEEINNTSLETEEAETTLTNDIITFK